MQPKAKKDADEVEFAAKGGSVRRDGSARQDIESASILRPVERTLGRIKRKEAVETKELEVRRPARMPSVLPKIPLPKNGAVLQGENRYRKIQRRTREESDRRGKSQERHEEESPQAH